jgi:FtsP/CotA-like multicopper oxidase with cupredoxin domain
MSMTGSLGPTLTRRTLLITGAAAALSAGVSPWLRSAGAATELRLSADASSLVRLVPEPHAETAVWAYNGSVPGPEIRIRQGDRLRVVLVNLLREETTIHWHGVRVPNAMDGVPHLTQKPIAPGKAFVYEFDCPDAGTFWYHPHQRSLEQVDRGLAGALIVEEPQPIRVDRDVTWVLDDWRLLRDASISGDFGNMMDTGMSGRIGNTVTVNGRPTRYREWQDTVLMAPHERVEIAFVADNPGDWMLHCHILEHQGAGMMGVIRVSAEGART